VRRANRASGPRTHARAIVAEGSRTGRQARIVLVLMNRINSRNVSVKLTVVLEIQF